MTQIVFTSLVPYIAIQCDPMQGTAIHIIYAMYFALHTMDIGKYALQFAICKSIKLESNHLFL